MAKSGEPDFAHWIPTAQLLLNMPGVEVAARPWLYPRASFGDSDIKQRLVRLKQIATNQKPSLKTSYMRKLLSTIVDYEEDFPLACLLHDIALARQISSVVSIAESKNIAPEEAASDMQNFDVRWRREQEKLEDMCRQHGKLPNLFFTIAPRRMESRVEQAHASLAQSWRYAI